MSLKNKLMPLIFIFAVVLAACGGGEETAAPSTEAVPGQETSMPADNGDYGPTPVPNAAVAVMPTPESGAPAVTADFNTYVRGGPGTNYPVYGAFLGGISASATGRSEDGTWWVISIPVAANGEGWVPAAYVTASNAGSVPVVAAPPVPPTVNFQPPAADDPQGTALVETYVRSGPGLTYPAYGIAEEGVTAGIIGQSEDSQYWVVRVDPANIGAGFAWVEKAYVQASNVDDVPTIQTPPQETVVDIVPPAAGVPTGVAIEYLNVRTGPGTIYPILGVVAPGATGELTGRSQDGNWYAVKVSPEFYATSQAWVASAWVRTENADSLPVLPAPALPPNVDVPAPPPSQGGIGVAIEPINVRSGPGSQYPSYGVVPIGTEGQIIGVSEDGNWWVVAISTTVDPSGQGWVSAAYVLARDVEGVPVVPTPEMPPITDLPPVEGDVPVGTALEAINVRSGPGTEFPSYGIAPQGATGEVTGVLADGTWYQIKAPALSPDGIAWVAAAYVTVTNAENIPVVSP
jgi:uncharacterized protein YraI